MSIRIAVFAGPARFSARLRPALAGFFLAGAVLSVGARAQLPPAQHSGQVEYVSGGIGQDESSAFRQARGNYPLALTFAVEGGGGSSPYASGVDVVVENRQGQRLLNVTSDGPYLLARLAPGTYKVNAAYNGQLQTREVTVPQSGTADVKFAWKRPAGGPD